jgi:hypothetical protein
LLVLPLWKLQANFTSRPGCLNLNRRITYQQLLPRVMLVVVFGWMKEMEKATRMSTVLLALLLKSEQLSSTPECVSRIYFGDRVVCYLVEGKFLGKTDRCCELDARRQRSTSDQLPQALRPGNLLVHDNKRA